MESEYLPCRHYSRSIPVASNDIGDGISYHYAFDQAQQFADSGCTFCKLICNVVGRRCKTGCSAANTDSPHVCTLLNAIFALPAGERLGDDHAKWLHSSSATFFLLSVAWTCGYGMLELCQNEDSSTGDEDAGDLPGSIHKQLAKCPGTINHDPLDALPECRQWLRDCQTEHTACRPSRTTCTGKTSPKFLLYVLDVVETGIVRLHITDEAPSAVLPQYVALSYCWGIPHPPKTLRCNIGQFLEFGIRHSTLPATYRDAIRIASNLGYEYLWIDALCIVQDDDDMRNQEISVMHEIYSAADLVLCVAEATSTWEEFLHRRPESMGWSEVVGVSETMQIRFRDFVRAHGRVSSDSDAISARAWTYQEKLLAHRCLIFRKHEIIWECLQSLICECSGRNRSHREESDVLNDRRLINAIPLDQERVANATAADRGEDTNPSTEEALQLWKRSVEHYSGRELSVFRDRLPAISALHNRLKAAFGPFDGRSYAGLWALRFVDQLMWAGQWSWDVCTRVKAAEAYMAPSFSWASYLGAVTYSRTPTTPAGRWDYKASLVKASEVAVTLSGVGYRAEMAIEERTPGQPYAYRSHVVPDHAESFVVEGGRNIDRIPVKTMVKREHGELKESIRALEHDYRSDMQRECEGTVFLFWLSTGSCLVLTFREEEVPGTYQRLGIIFETMPAAVRNSAHVMVRIV